MSCVLCLGNMTEATTLLEINSKEAQKLGVCGIIEAHFGMEVDSTESSICRYCLYKICEFHEFFTGILNVHGLQLSSSTKKLVNNTTGMEDRSDVADVQEDNGYETLDTGLSTTDSDGKAFEYNAALLEDYKNITAGGDINLLFKELDDISMEIESDSDLSNNSKPLESYKENTTTNLDHLNEENSSNSSPEVGHTVQPNFTLKKALPTKTEYSPKLQTRFCSSCGLIIRENDILLNTHDTCLRPRIYKETLRQAFTCEFCYLNFKSARFLRLHRLTEHHDETYTCCICNERFKNVDEMYVHANSHNNYTKSLEDVSIYRIYLCNKEGCDEVFSTWLALCQHKQTHKAADVDKVNKPALESHSTTKLVTYQCQMCEKNCPSRMSLSVHQARTHKISSCTCPMCKGTYKNERSLQQHIALMHEPLPCTHCQKLIKNRRNLIIHERVVHQNEHRYFCNECNKGFFYRSEMNSHFRSVHSNVIYKCEECTFNTVYSKSMEIHQAMHKQMLTFACPYCSKKFGRKIVLDAHIKRHQKRQFVCSEHIANGCDATFITNNLLQKHILQNHNKVEPTADKIPQNTRKKCARNNAKQLEDIIIEETCDYTTFSIEDNEVNDSIIVLDEESLRNPDMPVINK